MSAVVAEPVRAVLEVARGFVGAREHAGPNRGLEVDFCNRWTFGAKAMQPFPTGGLGAPWCATFVHLCGRLGIGAAWPFPAATPAMSNVDEVVAFASERGVFYPEGTPRRGDLVAVRHWSQADDWTHIGFVSEPVGSDGHFETIEGNTNEDGSRDGNGVYVRRRMPSTYLHLIRWPELLT